MAWSRMDVDLDRGEALIEEVQNDWIREAEYERRRLERYLACTKQCNCRMKPYAKAALRYVNQVLAPYVSIWDQAMLSATLFFLREELGIGSIRYHTWETGNALKRIDGLGKPPRSLYSRLPRQFCFTEVSDSPELLSGRQMRRRLRRAKAEAKFFHLAI